MRSNKLSARQRHASRSQSSTKDLDKKMIKREENMRDLLLRKDNGKEELSTVRKTLKRKNEDYRHLRMTVSVDPKRRSAFQESRSKRTRRNTRPSFDTMEFAPTSLTSTEEDQDYQRKEDSKLELSDNYNQNSNTASNGFNQNTSSSLSGKAATKDSSSSKVSSKNSQAENVASKDANSSANSSNGTPDEAETEEVKSNVKSKAIINHDWCACCGGTGQLVCCEDCANSFHFSCIEPPVMSEAELADIWRCRSCEPYKYSEEEEKEFQTTLFAPMFAFLASSNPSAFKLPLNLRKMFDQVQETEEGEFEDQFMKIKRVNDDKKVSLCYKCQNSDLEKPLAHCAECDTCWHIDCLLDPLESVPEGYWICPLHMSELEEAPRPVKAPILTTVLLPRNVTNCGDIEILDEDDSPNNSKVDSKEASQTDDNPDSVRIEPEGYNYSDEETVHEVKYVAQTQLDAQGNIYKKLPKKKSQAQNDRIVYQIPARTIKLDFINTIYGMKNDNYNYKTNLEAEVIGVLNELADKPDKDREAVRNLMTLKLQGPAVDKATAKRNMAILVEAALNNDDEVGQMTAIKKLMLEKGKDRLMKMLMNN